MAMSRNNKTSVMKCIHCGENVSFKYRVSECGDVFCDDDCYEQYGDDHLTGLFHPYLDVYEYVRREYIEWISAWEDRLVLADNYIAAINKMISAIDALIDEHIDFYMSDGDDGVFHSEIKAYLHKLKRLEQTIVQWRPDRDVYYQVLVIFHSESSIQLKEEHDDCISQLKEEVIKRSGNRRHEVIDDLELSLDRHEHRIHSDNVIHFTYETREEAEEAMDHLQAFFSRDIEEVLMEEAHLCDSGCGMYLAVSDADDDFSGWYYSDLCIEEDQPGIFSKEELLSLVIQEVADVPYPIDFWFAGKIKRSCITYDVDYPEWTALGEW